MESSEEKKVRISNCVFCKSYEHLLIDFPKANSIYNDYCLHKISIHNLKLGIDF